MLMPQTIGVKYDKSPKMHPFYLKIVLLDSLGFFLKGLKHITDFFLGGGEMIFPQLDESIIAC